MGAKVAVLIVVAHRRSDRLRGPVNHKVVDEHVGWERLQQVIAMVAPEVEFLHNPASEAHGRVRQSERQGLGSACGADARRRLPLSPTAHSEPCKPSQHQSGAGMSPSEAGPRPLKYEYPDRAWGISMPGGWPLRPQCRCLPRYTRIAQVFGHQGVEQVLGKNLMGDASAGQRSQTREGWGLRHRRRRPRDRQMPQGRRALAPALYTPRSWMANRSSRAAAWDVRPRPFR